MNKDQELADRVVALGIGESSGKVDSYGQYTAWYSFDKNNEWPHQFVMDWRVAGALMEKLIKAGPDKLRTVAGSWYPTTQVFAATIATSAAPTYGVYSERVNESLPRAIIEACVEALETD